MFVMPNVSLAEQLPPTSFNLLLLVFLLSPYDHTSSQTYKQTDGALNTSCVHTNICKHLPYIKILSNSPHALCYIPHISATVVVFVSFFPPSLQPAESVAAKCNHQWWCALLTQGTIWTTCTNHSYIHKYSFIKNTMLYNACPFSCGSVWTY